MCCLQLNYKQCNVRDISVTSAAVCMATQQQQTVTGTVPDYGAVTSQEHKSLPITHVFT
jgi:hypothetical protein